MVSETVDREKAIRQALASGKTYAAVGLELGMSRQRVQQLISPRETAIGIGVCPKCGREAILHRHHSNYMAGRYKALCIPCHRAAHKKPKRATGNCPICGRVVYSNYKYCSPECRHEAACLAKVKLVCATCGIEFLRRRADVLARHNYKERWANRTDNYFCSKQCQGFYTGANYGFRVHPELINKSGLPIGAR